ncbi:hypothetical protein CAPTEDRAFT_197736 [Capitella teleta]|uniref:Uncharacterized protein n=1 Tax=Capitella teleta TaxID=283909 RepID=R7TZ16_CAPTE|nr:hypothetical protein CAPTEDRAFT_197736 [Capitella teleta]|eukprot:ELT98994.1 hypothetical protein CAPTEDRAFT_197736 [Capitella teleta]
MNIHDLVRDAVSGKYLYTLCDEASSRILCLDCCYGDSVSLVTGGFELRLWTQLRGNASVGSDDCVVSSQYIPQFSRQARHSDVESDGETSEADLPDDDANNPPLPWQHKEAEEEKRGWFSSCQIL